MGWLANITSRFRPRAAALAQASEDTFEEEIPRYPPFVKGLPAAEPVRLVRSQQELINKIRQALPHTDDELDLLVMPVIERYAAYVHLLPASQSHHHRGAGGLFRHGLEVAFYAVQRAGDTDFCAQNTPANKTKLEPRWLLASFLGGLLHDVGKPITDVTVTTRDGMDVWNPYDATLYQWCVEQNVSSYYIAWAERRNKKHERFSLTNLDMILTRHVRSYLNVLGPHVMEAMLEAIAGSSVQDPLPKLVMWADQQSTGKDMRKQKLAIDPFHHHVPVEKFVFDALARIAQKEKVNEPGAQIWVSDQGAFLYWKPIAEKIVNQLSKDNIPGIPRDPVTLANILIDKGFATPRTTKTGKSMMYWTVYPEIKEGEPVFYQNCLLIEDLDYVFAVEPQTRAVLRFNPDEDAKVAPPSTPSPESASNSSPEDATPASEPANLPITDVEIRQRMGDDICEQLDEFGPDREQETNDSIDESQEYLTSPSVQTNATLANEDLPDTPGLKILIEAAQLQKDGSQTVFTTTDKRSLMIEFPDHAKLLHADTKELIRILSSEDLIVSEVGKWVSTINNKKYLRLSPKSTKVVRSVLDAAPADSIPPKTPEPVVPTRTPSRPTAAVRHAAAEDNKQGELFDRIVSNFMEQLVNQGGDLIVGDVEFFENASGACIYRTSDGALRKIAQKYSITDINAVVALKRHPHLKIKDNRIIVTIQE